MTKKLYGFFMVLLSILTINIVILSRMFNNLKQIYLYPQDIVFILLLNIIYILIILNIGKAARTARSPSSKDPFSAGVVVGILIFTTFLLITFITPILYMAFWRGSMIAQNLNVSCPSQYVRVVASPGADLKQVPSHWGDPVYQGTLPAGTKICEAGGIMEPITWVSVFDKKNHQYDVLEKSLRGEDPLDKFMTK